MPPISVLLEAPPGKSWGGFGQLMIVFVVSDIQP
jgi:hypothetical protein